MRRLTWVRALGWIDAGEIWQFRHTICVSRCRVWGMHEAI